MTSTINNQTASVRINGNGELELSVNGQEITFPASAATSVVTAVLAGRKEALEVARVARQLKTAAAKAERERKAKERKADQAAKAKARVLKLEAKLAEARAKARKAA